MSKSCDPTEQFVKIRSRINKYGLPAEKVENLRSIKRISSQVTFVNYVGAFFLGVFSVFIGCTLILGLYSKEGFSRIWFIWEGIDPNVEMCTVEMPGIAHDAFRPPVNCSMCKDINGVERTSGLTIKQFEKRHAYSGRPVVITDATANWTAHEAFTFEFFRSLYPEDSPLMNDECQFFPYKTEFESVNEVFNMSVERATLRDGSNPWYIGWSNCDQKATEKLRKHYSRPYFLPKDSESSKTDWIFMGSPGYGAHMHIDHVGQASWQAQIKGTKMWTLQPPPECYSECNTLEVTVNRGDIIVLDTNKWYHKTYVVGDDMSITIGSEYD